MEYLEKKKRDLNHESAKKVKKREIKEGTRLLYGTGISRNVIQMQPAPNEYRLAQVNTGLEVQTGPSCWLYVYDAILQEQGKTFNPVKYFYPDKKAIAGGGGNRDEALRLAIERAQDLVARLENIKKNQKNQKNQKERANIIDKERLWDIARRTGMDAQANERMRASLYGEKSELPIDTLQTALTTGIETTKQMKATISKNNRPPADGQKTELEVLMNRGKINFGPNIGTILYLKFAFLDVGGSFPMYMSVNKRFSPREEGGEGAPIYDFSEGEPQSMKMRGAHALLLTGVDYGVNMNNYRKENYKNPYAIKNYEMHRNVNYHKDIWLKDDDYFDDGYVVYKDPNYGDHEIKIKWSQLKDMSMNGDELDAEFSVIPV